MDESQTKMESTEELSLKIQNKHKNTCEKCNKRFSNASKLRRHEISHCENMQFQCNQCPKHFKFKASLQRHCRHSHQAIKQHKCNKCQRSFSQRINLHMHQQRLHNRITSFKCTECECFFPNKNTLSRHRKERHTQQLDNEEQMQLFDDPNSLAELVVTQLKSLEQSISSIKTENANQNTTTAFVTSEEQATNFVEQAKFGETYLKVKLNGESTSEANIIKVQTVKRSKERLAYVCQYCGKEFHKNYNFIRHLRIHTKERPYGCSVCNSNFITKTQLGTHFKRMHILNEETGYLSHQHSCYICFTKFSSMRKLDFHMKSHAGSHCVEYFCKLCNRKFSTKTAFSTHKHDNEDKELEVLEKLLPQPIALNLENGKILNSKLVDKVFTCSICNLKQHTQQELYRHQKQHEHRRRFKCKVCGSSYVSNVSLRTHQKLHNIEKCYSCKLCSNRKFPTKSQLERHHRHVHQEERNFQCSYCSQRFKSSTHCKSHMKTHIKKLLGTTPPQQNQLKIATSTTAEIIVREKNSTLNSAKFVQIEMVPKHPKFKHRNIQVELTAANSSFEAKAKSSKCICNFCDKSFQKPSDLLRHVRLHTQERPFHCDICKKPFKLKSTLDDHRKIHLSSNERSKTFVACQVCGKNYATKKSLAVHLRLHTGKFPFQCESCGKSFRTSGHRLAHLKAAKSKNGNCINFVSILQ